MQLRRIVSICLCHTRSVRRWTDREVFRWRCRVFLVRSLFVCVRVACLSFVSPPHARILALRCGWMDRVECSPGEYRGGATEEQTEHNPHTQYNTQLQQVTHTTHTIPNANRYTHTLAPVRCSIVVFSALTLSSALPLCLCAAHRSGPAPLNTHT